MSGSPAAAWRTRSRQRRHDDVERIGRITAVRRGSREPVRLPSTNARTSTASRDSGSTGSAAARLPRLTQEVHRPPADVDAVLSYRSSRRSVPLASRTRRPSTRPSPAAQYAVRRRSPSSLPASSGHLAARQPLPADRRAPRRRIWISVGSSFNCHQCPLLVAISVRRFRTSARSRAGRRVLRRSTGRRVRVSSRPGCAAGTATIAAPRGQRQQHRASVPRIRTSGRPDRPARAWRPDWSTPAA